MPRGSFLKSKLPRGIRKNLLAEKESIKLDMIAIFHVIAENTLFLIDR